VLVSLLVTHGIAAVAALGAEKAIRPVDVCGAPCSGLDSAILPATHQRRPSACRASALTLPDMLWHT
jgi:hypothetical protein